jgi:hypothetical protein
MNGFPPQLGTLSLTQAVLAEVFHVLIAQRLIFGGCRVLFYR